MLLPACCDVTVKRKRRVRVSARVSYRPHPNTPCCHPQPRSGIADIPVGTGRNYRTGIDFLPNFPDPESRCTLEGGARKLGFVYHFLWFCNLGIHIRRTPRRTPRRSPTVTNMCICMLTRIPGVALVHTSGKPILKGTRKEQRHYLSLGLNFGVELVEVNLPQFAHLFQN